MNEDIDRSWNKIWTDIEKIEEFLVILLQHLGERSAILSSSTILLVSKDEVSCFIVDRSFKLWRSHRFNY